MVTKVGSAPNEIPLNNDLGSMAYQNRESVTVGLIQATSGFFMHSATITQSAVIATGNNAMSSGPVTIADGVSVTVPDGSRWVVV